MLRFHKNKEITEPLGKFLPGANDPILGEQKPSLVSKLKNRFLNFGHRSTLIGIIVVLGTAGIGTYLLFFSHADTFGTIRPAVIRNADGRLEVFSIGANQALYHEWQLTPGGTWSGWESLGGYVNSDPAVVKNADGRLEVFVRSGDLLYHKWQTVPGGAWTPNWISLGGSIRNDPAVAMNADGRLEVFANGADQQLYHQWQTVPGGAWSGGWVSVGSGQLTLDPTVIRNPDGRLELFQRGTNGAMYHMWQAVPGGAWSAWTWLGGNIISDIAIGTNADGRLEAFASGTNQQLYHNYQLSPGGAWSGWTSLGGTLIGDSAVATNIDGRLELFDVGSNNQLYHQWQATPNGTWSGWSSLQGNLIANPAVGANADGHLEVFARGTNSELYHNWQTVPNGGAWTGWYSLGPVEQASSIGSNLGIGGSVQVGQALVSPSHTYQAAMQTDGNFVVRRLSDQAAIWATGTNGSGANVLNFQTDGNLVVRPAGGAAAWASGTNTFGGTTLTMQDDGNLVQYNASGTAVWSWETGKIPPPPPPTVSLDGPLAVPAGNTPNLLVATTNATACNINGTSSLTNGYVVKPAIASTTTYTLQCSGPGGSATDSVTTLAVDTSSPLDPPDNSSSTSSSSSLGGGLSLTTLPHYNNNWSGYVDAGSTKFTEVEGSVKIPNFQCPVTDSPISVTSIWIGIDGAHGVSPTVQQVGVEILCEYFKHGHAAHAYIYPWWEMYAKGHDRQQRLYTQPLSVGDQINMKVWYDSSTKKYGLYLNDITNGIKFTKYEACAAGVVCSNASTEWITERPGYGSAPGVHYPYTIFQPITFTDVEASTSSSFVAQPFGNYTNWPVIVQLTSGNPFVSMPNSINPGDNKLTVTFLRDI